MAQSRKEAGSRRIYELPDVIYTTSNKDDIIQVWGSTDVVPTAGSLDAVEASIIATKLF